MKKQLLFLCITLTLCVDLCTEFTTYQACIATQVDQCRWMPLFSECIRSDNYLMGCDTTISEKLCVKQVGTVLGEMALCVFERTCHQIPNAEALKCSDKLTRAGCLSVSAADQHCKWENHQCMQIEDFADVQKNFMNYELSVSVCPLINGYLIMHHSLLWPLLEYEPDLIEESDNLILEDEGQYEYTPPTYSTGILQNNYVNADGDYQWYKYKVTKVTAQSNLKMNDYTRLGCIALEILSDSDFLNYFSLRGIINGVNHIYCKYLTQHPTDPQFVIFKDNKCIPTTIDEIHNDQFIQQISCKQMSAYICQRLFNKQCMIQGSGEYDCIAYDQKLYQTNTNCANRNGQAIAYQCQESDYCFLNILQASAYCDNSCATQSSQLNCLNNSQCLWYGDDTVSSADKLKYCVPYNGCNTYGMSKQYCIEVAIPCYWNEQIQKCQDSPNLYLVKCTEANTIYTCTSITRYDQFCLWYKNECINVREQPLMSHFKSLPEYIMMNRNACIQMQSEYYYYVPMQKQCVFTRNIIMKCLLKSLDTYKQDLITEDLPCPNSETSHITKYFCLNFISSNTKWDPYNQRCLSMADTQLNKPCDSYTLVNPRICSQSYVPNTHYCFYDDKLYSCYSVKKADHTMKCTDKGLDKTQCTNITTQGEYCQWSYGKCRKLIYRQILPYKCNSLLQVNGNSCQYFTTSTSCLYDPEYTSCAVGYGPESTCNNNLNPQACQESNASCYYDFVQYKCFDTTPDILSKIHCTGSNVSQSACGNITTPNQQCVWDSGCKQYSDQYTITCNTYSVQNAQVCKYLQSAFVNFFLDGSYCELINNQCTATRDIISDCGTNRDINVHRCVAYTQQQCYYDKQYQCLQVYDDEYQQILLNTLNCTQSNLNLCGKIQTKGQTCWVIDNNQNVKCSYYSSSKTYTCLEMQSLNFSNQITLDSKGKKQWYNQNMCYLATDSCFYENYQCKQDLNRQLKCNSPGLSKVFCLTQTIGNCVFNNRTCEYLVDLTLGCEFRNQGACYMGGLKCKWDDTKKLCKLDTSSCPTSPYSTSFSWLSCSKTSTSNCWAYINSCSTSDDIDDLPCDVGLSQGACQSQSHVCIWQNNRCYTFNPKQHNCQNSQSLNDCMSNYNLSEYCVYANNKCFAVDPSQFECDDFPQVSINYCYYFNKCVYNASTNQCLNYRTDEFYAQTQRDVNNYSGVDCNSIDKSQCLFQKSNNCIINWGSCNGNSDSFDECPIAYLDYIEVEYSAFFCSSFDNCKFLGTRDLQYSLCEYISDPIVCSTLNEKYCLQDFPNLKCQYDYDNNQCIDIPEDINCDTIAGLSVSRESCKFANSNSTDKQCQFVNDGNQQCKILITEYTQSCADINNNYQDKGIIVQCAFTQNNCYIDFDNKQCTDTVPSGTNTKNIQLCTQQTDNNYLFNLLTYTCDQIDSSTRLFNCHFLNKQACLGLTNEHSVFKCIWSENHCRHISLSDYEDIPCENRNRFSCFLTYSQECHYDGQCKTANSEKLLVSPMVCQKQGLITDGENCVNVTNQPKSYYKCTSLDKDSCLNRTSYLYCYWNGTYCAEANLYFLNCNDEVSQQTCLALVGKVCTWSDTDGCSQLPSEQSCSTYDNNLNGCAALTTISCYYDQRFNQCRDVAQIYEACYEGLSLKTCKEVKNEVCVLINNKCSNIQPYLYQCTSIYNKFGCYYIDLSCIWSDELGCQPFNETLRCNQMPVGVNRHGCVYNSLPITGVPNCDQCSQPATSTGAMLEDCKKCNCSFDDYTQLCTYELSGQNMQEFDNLDQTGYEQIMLTGYCSDMIDQLKCVGNLFDSCKYINNQCVNSDFKGCKNQNRNACLEVTDEHCSWRDDACFPWNQNKFEIALVTKNVCRYLDQSLNAHYDANTKSCIQTDFSIADCNLVSVSRVTCLSIQNYQCTYDGDCKPKLKSSLSKCSEHKEITQQVCQQLSNLACKYDSTNFACIQTEESDDCTTLGLSQLGCVNIKTNACYWNGKQCQPFGSNNSINQCDNQTIVNSLACSSINYLTNTCSYDTMRHVCTPNFNRYSNCTTPGLNYWACVQSLVEPCQFLNNRCQPFVNGDFRCFQLQSVNSKVCQAIVTDTCAYEVTTHTCYSVLDFVQCNTVGVNMNSCSTLQNCLWNYDDWQCQCNQLNHKDVCYEANKDTCIENSNLCNYHYGQCFKKKCSDLLAVECSGIINNLTCYLDQDALCQSATQCEDIIYLHQNFKCDQFIFNKSACIQINNYCVSSTNLQQICINSDCSINSCILEHGLCRPLSCQDYNEQDCYLYQGCAFINNKCTLINSCNEINDAQICRLVTINNKPCSWEEYRILDATQICTNTQCELYAPAYTVCNGNEINGSTCILIDLIKCIRCEDVTDICTCNNSNNACVWQNNQCNSLSCFSFNNEQLCADSRRCYWSQQDKVCRKMCVQNIRQDQCEAVIYECHWNPYMRICEQGVEVIPDLSIDVDVEEEYSIILMIYIILIIQ